MNIKWARFRAGLCLLLCFNLGAAGAADLKIVPGHLRDEVAGLAPVRRLEAGRTVRLTIGLAPRDQPGLDRFLQELYDPRSTNYHHYLTPAQFAERFGPAPETYADLIRFAQESGLAVTKQFPNRVSLDAEGPAASVEKAFHVRLQVFQHPTEARTFYAPDSEPSVPANLPVSHIAGLDDYARPKHRHHHRNAAAETPRAGTAPGSQLWGSDFRNAYVPGLSLTGTGQNVGLLEFEGYYPSDIVAYEDAIQAPANQRPVLVPVPVDGGATPADGGDNGEECSLDLEIIVATAPGLSNIYVFESSGGGPGGGFDDILQAMVNQTNVNQFSCSWGTTGQKDTNSETLFQQMATQGQSFYNATGDSGAYVGTVDFPSDSPSITQVGGTTLALTASQLWQSEVVWDWDSGPNVSSRNATSSSGGISTFWSIPPWQAALGVGSSGGSPTMRNFPDVAANADNVYLFSDDGTQGGGWGGTSCAAPLWAAYTALVNEQAALNGEAPVGFLNPTLYALAGGTNYNNVFHDITSGNDTWKHSPNLFYAMTGFDLCTGLGSMNGINLLNVLAPAIPTPSFLAPALTNSGAGFALSFATAAGHSYQVQYTTSLAQPVWSNLGGAIAASGATATAVDSFTNALRFYRVVRVN